MRWYILIIALLISGNVLAQPAPRKRVVSASMLARLKRKMVQAWARWASNKVKLSMRSGG